MMVPFKMKFAALAAAILAISACSNSVSTVPATVQPSPSGIPIVSGGAGSQPISMTKGDTNYSIYFPLVNIVTKTTGYSKLPSDTVLVVFDVEYSVQVGSLDVVGSSDFEAYIDGTTAAKPAAFGYDLKDIGYVKLVAGTKTAGQFGYLVPKTANSLVLYFVDQFAQEPRIWQMNLDIAGALKE